MVSKAQGTEMNFQGTQQTCYADWSRAVLTYYPYNPTYQRNGDKISVIYNNQIVAEFDYSDGTGFIVQGELHNLDEVGTVPNFEVFDLDELISTA